MDAAATSNIERGAAVSLDAAATSNVERGAAVSLDAAATSVVEGDAAVAVTSDVRRDVAVPIVDEEDAESSPCSFDLSDSSFLVCQGPRQVYIQRVIITCSPNV